MAFFEVVRLFWQLVEVWLISWATGFRSSAHGFCLVSRTRRVRFHGPYAPAPKIQSRCNISNFDHSFSKMVHRCPATRCTTNTLCNVYNALGRRKTSSL